MQGNADLQVVLNISVMTRDLQQAEVEFISSC
jgi:hypothetical protein